MGKYSLYRLFNQVKEIRPYLPSTSICTLFTLAIYLHNFREVYIKPAGGGQGRGVTKAWRTNGRYYYVREKGDPVRCDTVAEMFRKLGLARKKPHIVQRGIQLARVNGRPFDVRVMMMRDRAKRWTYVGMLAKVAGRKSVITNVARGGGYVLPIDAALRQSLGLTGERAEQKKQEMIRLAQACNRAYSRVRYDWQIGYDLAIDRNGKVWFIETNPTIPAHGLFRKLPDQTMYRRIKELAAFHLKRK
ncbi:MAG TPA: YheC/YheD family protein [Bacilli bacterium]